MRVRETQLPGVGVRYNIEFDHGREFVIVLHNDGDRETFWKGTEDADSNKLFKVSESEARKLAEIFNGTYFQPVGKDLEEVFNESQVRWIHISSDTPFVGQTISESHIRHNTGVSVIAIQREDQTISNPSKEEIIHADDVLVTVGNETQYSALEQLLE